ncbi:MAG: hypothetical protein AB1607_05235 [Chloroflexota bacterium]
MENKPAFDRGLILPIILGAFSIFGICLVLLLARLSTFRAVTEVENTSTPFRFLFLGTEPGISTTTPEEEEEQLPPPTEAPITFASSTPKTEETIDSVASPTRTRTPPPAGSSSATPTTASSAPLNPGTYDQSDQRIEYTDEWIAQTGVAGVFQNTLHVSNTLDSSASFRFIGEQIRIFYQSGSGLGTIRISLDGFEYDLDESAEVVVQSEWISPVLINGTHTVTITHLSGGAVNLDMIIVPEVFTTATPTP